MSTAELACSYAALILADDGVEVTVRTWPLLSVLELCAMDGRIIYWDYEQEIICGSKKKDEKEKIRVGDAEQRRKDARFNTTYELG